VNTKIDMNGIDDLKKPCEFHKPIQYVFDLLEHILKVSLKFIGERCGSTNICSPL
jgi:hypothetical protein